MMQRAVLFLLLAVTTSCVSKPPTSPGGPLSVRVVLAPGETTQIDGASFRLRFQGVLGDSRCPADAICIQGGDALVRIEVIPSRAPSTAYDLHTGSMAPIRHDDVTVALVDLSPYPFIARPIAPRDYRATLDVTR